MLLAHFVRSLTPHPRSIVAQLTEDWLAHAKPRLRSSWHCEATRLLSHLSPDLLALREDRVGKADIARELKRLSATPGVQRTTFTALRSTFKWACASGRLEANPCAGLSVPRSASRDRVLSERELVAIWRATLSAKCPSDYGRIIRLLMLTGQRRDEIGHLSWEEIEAERAQIALPASRCKNKRAHVVPLSPLALAQLPGRGEGLAATGLRPYVFGMRSGRPYSGWSKSKRTLDGLLGGLPHWTVHDLRRSFVTHVMERGLALPHVIEAVVNHQSGAKGGVAGVYNKALYLAERRACLEAWADALEKIVCGAS